jgi:hypothetical protein
LQAALHAAGTHTAIASLWSVDDAATRELIERSHSYLWKAKGDLHVEGRPVRDRAARLLSGDPEWSRPHSLAEALPNDAASTRR